MGFFRLALATLIIIFHFQPGSRINGQLVVESFFVISGFYMAMVIDQKYKDNKWAFYRARYLRLYPGYLVVTLTVLAINYFTDTGETGRLENAMVYQHNFSEIINFFHQINWFEKLYWLFANITMIGLDFMNFINIDESYKFVFTKDWNMVYRSLPYNFNMVAWALSLELWLYFIAPFIFFKRNWLILLLVIYSIIHKKLFSAYPMNSGIFPVEAGVFSLGYLAYLFYRKYQSRFFALQQNRYLLFIPIVITIIASFSFYYGWFEFEINSYITSYYLTLIVVAALCPLMFVLGSRIKIDNFAGKCSYYVYIGSCIPAYFIFHYIGKPISNVGYASTLTCVILTYLLAALMVVTLDPLADKIRFKDKRYKNS